MNVQTIVTFLALALGVFLALSGVAFFVVGLLPGKSAWWVKQYAYAAVCLTCAYYLFRWALPLT